MIVVDAEILNILRQPQTGSPLRLIRQETEEWLQADGGQRYTDDGGIIRFLKDDAASGSNLRYQRMYDRFAPLYDAITRGYARIRNGGEKNRVMQYLSALKIADNDLVVEISVGTGRNIKYLNPAARYFGVDISLGMLRTCARRMKKIGREIALIQAEAESLPFRDEAFDVVYSAGGFNFFNDRDKAVREMLRVAKSGTLLMISDETEKVRQAYRRGTLTGQFYSREQIANPAEIVAQYCKEYEYEEVCGGELYALTFRKP